MEGEREEGEWRGKAEWRVIGKGHCRGEKKSSIGNPLPHRASLKSHGSFIPRGYYRNLQSTCSTFFFTNFPDDFGVAEMWAIFQKYGSVGDVMIPKKRDRRGKRFGFVRFKQSGDDEFLEKALMNLWIGNFKVGLNRPRFERQGGQKLGGRGDQHHIRRKEEYGVHEKSVGKSKWSIPPGKKL
ncbi:hypothetical protein TanjilG_07824 [Lupinus angustifolius]|uniref:RRM domain-containing protein n=1 Tax=Lupinus angustifolius TaxID=3871 RepID=A0A1J7H977_LUPAN|nr:hypothetical protein TanjilG_07824 [Lupinus angustifolius]